MTAISNADAATAIIALLVAQGVVLTDASAATTALAAIFDEWQPLTTGGLAQQMADLMALIDMTIQVQLVSAPGPVGPSELLGGYLATSSGTFNLTLCRATSETPATASAVFTINRKRGGVSALWGTVTFAAGASGGSFAVTDPTVLPGDELLCIAPTTQDATLTSVLITLAGN